MTTGLASTSLLAPTIGAIMAICIVTRAMRPVGDNLILTVILLVIGLLLGLGAFYRGDRSTICKLSLGTSAFLLLGGGFLLLAISSTLRDLH
jgi:hypothetical protein